MNSFTVHLSDDAARDLEEIFKYIDRHDLPGRADYVLEQIEKAFSRLSDYPERGNYPENCWTSEFGNGAGVKNRLTLA